MVAGRRVHRLHGARGRDRGDEGSRQAVGRSQARGRGSALHAPARARSGGEEGAGAHLGQLRRRQLRLVAGREADCLRSPHLERPRRGRVGRHLGAGRRHGHKDAAGHPGRARQLAALVARWPAAGLRVGDGEAVLLLREQRDRGGHPGHGRGDEPHRRVRRGSVDHRLDLSRHRVLGVAENGHRAVHNGSRFARHPPAAVAGGLDRLAILALGRRHAGGVRRRGPDGVRRRLRRRGRRASRRPGGSATRARRSPAGPPTRAR